MRKKLFTLCTMLILVIVMAVSATAGDYAFYSGQKTADAAITAKPGYLYGVIVTGTNGSTVTLSIYDNASAASGSQVVPTILTYSAASDLYKSLMFPYPIKFFNGLYADVTIVGTGYYELYFRND